MKIFVEKYNGKGQQSTYYDYEVQNFTIVTNTTNLLLVKDELMEVDDNVVKSDCNFYEIFEVQFIANCKTELADGIFVAFYLVGGELSSYILSGLPGDYCDGNNEKFLLVDYVAYSKNCELTGEPKLSFFDYINEIKTGNLGVNTLLGYNGKGLAFDKQKELWERIDERKLKSN